MLYLEDVCDSLGKISGPRIYHNKYHHNDDIYCTKEIKK